MNQEQWKEAHQACPQCGSKNVEQTTLGPICLDPNNYRDDSNTAKCLGCNWVGKVNKLVPFTPPTIVRGEE